MLSLSSCVPAQPTVSATPSASGTPVITSTPTPIPEEIVQATIAKDTEWSVCAGVSQSEPAANREAVESLEIRNSQDDSAQVLVRIPLPAGITDDSVLSVSLRLKKMAGEASALQAYPVMIPWDRLGVSWDELEGNIGDPTPVGEAQEDDWYSIDITRVAKSWFGGEIGQYGLLLQETIPDSQVTLYSTYSYDAPENCPEIVINYKVPELSEPISAFDYESQEQGNCLSFALRDKNPIMAEELQVDMAVVERLYKEQGIDGASAYVEDLALQYIDLHKEKLDISQIRRLDTFDAPIDGAKEFRIATRIGIVENFDGSLAFDYHWQVQLEDGSWAEKFGPSASRIIPGSNAALDPSAYPWDQNEMWGFEAWTAFYTSEVSYFAVTKDTQEFTAHGE